MSTVRVALIGDQGVGKTSLILAAAQKSVRGDTPAPTLLPTKIELAWDTYHAICICHDTNSESAEEIVSTIRKCDVVLVCFAMDNPVTLKNAIHTWLPLSNSANDQLPIMLVGCKYDISVMTPGHPAVRSSLSSVCAWPSSTMGSAVAAACDVFFVAPSRTCHLQYFGFCWGKGSQACVSDFNHTCTHVVYQHLCKTQWRSSITHGVKLYM
jgi:hypothetical protein